MTLFRAVTLLVVFNFIFSPMAFSGSRDKRRARQSICKNLATNRKIKVQFTKPYEKSRASVDTNRNRNGVSNVAGNRYVVFDRPAVSIVEGIERPAVLLIFAVGAMYFILSESCDSQGDCDQNGDEEPYYPNWSRTSSSPTISNLPAGN